jgi:methionyl-tRNA synthetase
MCKGKYVKSAVDKELSGKLKFKEISGHMDNYEFDKALGLIFEYLDECNTYVQKNEPWKLEGKQKEKVLYSLVDSIRVSSILLYPFMPAASDRIKKQFGFDEPSIKKIKFGLTKSGKIEKADILFKKIE